LAVSLTGNKLARFIATAKTLRTLLMAETIDFIASSFFLLPSAITSKLWIKNWQ
jgi:hypothetical protein